MHQIYIQDLYLPLHITYISTFKKFHKNTHLKVPGPRYRGGIHQNPSTAEVEQKDGAFATGLSYMLNSSQAGLRTKTLPQKLEGEQPAWL